MLVKENPDRKTIKRYVFSPCVIYCKKRKTFILWAISNSAKMKHFLQFKKCFKFALFEMTHKTNNVLPSLDIRLFRVVNKLEILLSVKL